MKKPKEVPLIERSVPPPTSLSGESPPAKTARAATLRAAGLVVLGLVLAGVLFQYWLLAEFETNLLDFVGLEDLLLAVVRRPTLIAALTIGGLPLAILWRFRAAYGRIRLTRRLADGRSWIWIPIGILYFAALTRSLALYEVSRVRAGSRSEVELELASAFSMQSLRVKGHVLAATRELVFLAVPGERGARIIPFATIRQLVAADD